MYINKLAFSIYVSANVFVWMARKWGSRYRSRKSNMDRQKKKGRQWQAM